MEKIATSTYSFEKLRRGGYVYVDKTDLLWRLVSDTEDSQFFMSRPRRFGKSLMLSTLKCIFEGKRELFKGLKIEKKKYDWKTYPVVMLNMAEVVAPTVDKVRENLSDMVDGLVSEFKLGSVRRVSEPGKSLGNFFKANDSTSPSTRSKRFSCNSPALAPPTSAMFSMTTGHAFPQS